MPAHDVGRFLGEALRSVLAQTHSNTEVVLVDDGSRDETARVARSFSDPRLRYVRNETNLGCFPAINRALGLARGELVAVYHSDDRYEPTIVEKEVSFLRCHPRVGAVFCLDHYMDAEGRVFGGTELPRELRGRSELRYEEVFPFLLRRRNVLLRAPTFMARREVLEEVGPFDAEGYGVQADLELWIRILRRFPIGMLDEKLMFYRVGRHQTTTRYHHLRTSAEYYFAIMDHYLEVDSWRERLDPRDLAQYEFHRRDDDTLRAANHLIQGQVEPARALLAAPIPWRALLVDFRRRKLRVLLLRGLMRAGIALRAFGALRRILWWTEYPATRWRPAEGGR
jgi:glycosyltransferase involved in cell wall biosynthesis